MASYSVYCADLARQFELLVLQKVGGLWGQTYTCEVECAVDGHIFSIEIPRRTLGHLHRAFVCPSDPTLSEESRERYEAFLMKLSECSPEETSLDLVCELDRIRDSRPSTSFSKIVQEDFFEEIRKEPTELSQIYSTVFHPERFFPEKKKEVRMRTSRIKF